MSELVLTIGNKNLSSWSLRPWLVLKHAGISFQERVLQLDTEGFPAAIAALSPTRRVPVLHVSGPQDLVVWDSLAICEYVSDLHPEAKLWPAALDVRARARAVSAEMHSGFASLRREMPMEVVARHPRRAMSRETEDDIARVLAIWSEARGPFLFGDFTIADAMFAPVVWRFRTYGVDVPEGARAYYETMLALPAMLAWERDAKAEVAQRALLVAAADLSHPAAPRCYAVIFSSQRTHSDAEAYERASAAMAELASKQPGFLAIESARGADGFGITVSYWESLEAIRNWKDVPSHAAIQAQGKKTFYERYEVRVAVVERGYKFPH